LDLGGGIWMSGFGLASDNDGNIYCATGNGKFNTNDPNVVDKSYADSIIKLSKNLEILDYFTPHNQLDLENNDWDVAAGGVMLLPLQQGSIPNMLVCCGKYPAVFLINCQNMGKFNPNTDNVIQTLLNQVGGPAGQREGVHGGPAYLRTFSSQFVYYAGDKDSLKAFEVRDGHLSQVAVSKSLDIFPGLGSIPSISSNGTIPNTAIIWTLDRNLRPQAQISMHMMLRI
jgi:hypothetical protein